ncbi:MAG: indole-3-glycerol phosphate synthase TrpC [Bacteroidetes bacterium]|nr:indole-3-glycerol phosphate synthase TrpC [Bacteroidota bacterium]
MNILDTIIENKKQEVSSKKAERCIADLERSVFFARETLSLKKFLSDESRTGIIAEFKRKSPSKGIINAYADVAEITKSYTDNGASALSVLTDEKFFGGSADDLMKARNNQIPILRKDFIIDEYQVIEAKSVGADAILLIAACLTPRQVQNLAKFARSLHLQTLLELHEEEELQHICEEIEIVGINNRNLKTFEVDIARSLRMAEKIPSGKIKIAESGISSVENIALFKQHGFKGFLIGENFMKEKKPSVAFASFVNKLKNTSMPGR